MTWLTELPVGDSDWDSLSRQWPEAFVALAGLVGAAWDEADPVLLELCRLRMATLLKYTSEGARRSTRARLAGATDEKVADLAQWPTSPLFTEGERACLALTEQFVIDVNGVTDAHINAITDHLGPRGCFGFVPALSALETFQRAWLTLGIHTAPDTDVLARLGGEHRSS